MKIFDLSGSEFNLKINNVEDLILKLKTELGYEFQYLNLYLDEMCITENYTTLKTQLENEFLELFLFVSNKPVQITDD